MVCEVKLEERDFDVGVQGFDLLDHGTDFGFIAPTEDDLSGISVGKGSVVSAPMDSTLGPVVRTAHMVWKAQNEERKGGYISCR